MNKRINPAGLYEPNRGIYTQVITAGGGTQIHIAGLVPWDKNKTLVGKDDMASQVKQILDNMDQALTAAERRPWRRGQDQCLHHRRRTLHP